MVMMQRGILFLFFMFALTVQPTFAWAEDLLGGKWVGTYSCAGNQGARLEIELVDRPASMVEGVFAFEVNGQSGSYRVAGRLLPDGTFTLVPREWIERPPGFAALAAEGRLNPNGRVIEGSLTPCGMSKFVVTRDAPVETGDMASSTPEPLAGGAFAGVWQGGIQCRQNRRGKVEVYPLRLAIYSDGDGSGALASLRVWEKLGSGGGAAVDQQIVLSGTETAGTLRLSRNAPINLISRRTNLASLELTPSGKDRLSGSVRLATCETVELQREGANKPVELRAEQAGAWVNAASVGSKNAVSLHVAAGREPFAELRASYPLDRPEPQRDVLRLMLAPVVATDRSVVWVPVNARQATGVFAGVSNVVHVLSSAQAFVMSQQPDGNVLLEAATRGPGLDLALADPARERVQNGVLRLSMVRADAAGAVVGSGPATPPVRFQATIGGLVAAAPSREAQCKVLEEWLAPYSAGVDMQRQSIDVILGELAPAFDDAAFQPVFGVPFLLTSQAERTELARFMNESCQRAEGMRLVGSVGDWVFRSQNGFAKFAAMVTNKTDTLAWLNRSQEEISSLSSTDESIERIAALRRETETRRSDLNKDDYRDFRAALDTREAELRAGIFLIQAQALPNSGFEQGALSGVLRLMEKMERSGLSSELLRPAREIAREQAAAILDIPVAAAGALAAQLPGTLDGLQQGQQALNVFSPYRAQMERYFGTLDGTGRLRPLYARLAKLRTDPAVVAEFRALLEGLEPAAGVSPADRIWQVAGMYLAKEDLTSAPDMSDAVFRSIDLVELRAVEIVDRSGQVSVHEPTANEIARFALQRVRNYNEGMAQQEEVCLSGKFTDSVQALICLYNPAVWTGKTGFRANLLRVEKIGCREDQPEQQYTCNFSQTIDIDIPGGEAFGSSTLGRLARDLGSQSASETRFIRQADGGWTGITEIEN